MGIQRTQVMTKKNTMLTLQVIADDDNTEEANALLEISKIYLENFRNKPHSHFTSMPLADCRQDF